MMGRRILIAAPLLALLACGTDPSQTNGSGGTTTSGANAGGSGQGGASDGGGGLAQGGDAQGGGATNPDPCDPIAQNCVEDAASKCALSFDAADDVTFACQEPLGSAGLDETCERPDGVPGEDTCAAGLFCGNWGTTSLDERVCHALCDDVDACGDDAMCLGIRTEPAIGVCRPTCDPHGDGCGDGTACLLYQDITGAAEGTCLSPGAGTTDDPCPGGAQDCSAGFVCMGLGPQGACRSVCNEMHPCAGEGACLPILNAWGHGYCNAVSWSCVGSVTWDTPTESTAVAHVAVSSAVSKGPVGATVRACAADDADCATPLALDEAGMDGLAELTVPLGSAGFDGYFEIDRLGYPTTLVYPSRPIAGDGTTTAAVLYDPNLLAVLGYGDPSRGDLFTVSVDCNGNASGQLTLSSELVDGTSLVQYPSLTSAGHPDPEGVGTIFGLAAVGLHPPGQTTISLTAPESGVVATRSVRVRAGAVTVVHVEPTP